MTPTQRDLILAALGLTPRDGVMPRRSRRNLRSVAIDGPEFADWEALVEARRAAISGSWSNCGVIGKVYRVTRAGAEAAGVLGRCKREHVGR